MNEQNIKTHLEGTAHEQSIISMQLLAIKFRDGLSAKDKETCIEWWKVWTFLNIPNFSQHFSKLFSLAGVLEVLMLPASAIYEICSFSAIRDMECIFQVRNYWTGLFLAYILDSLLTISYRIRQIFIRSARIKVVGTLLPTKSTFVVNANGAFAFHVSENI